MPKPSDVRSAANSKERPFGRASDDEVVEILIPEGAASGKIPADDQYIGRCLGFTQETSKKNNPMLVWQFQIEEGEFAGMDFTLWTPLIEAAMWKMSETLTALGVRWEPGTPVRLRSADVKNILVRMRIIDDNFEGQQRSKLQGVLPHPDGAGTKAKGTGFRVPAKAQDDEEEEEEVAPKKRKAVREEEDEEEDETPRRGKSRKPVEDDEEEEEEQPKKRRKGWFADDEDEEEEEEQPRRGRPAGKKSRL